MFRRERKSLNENFSKNQRRFFCFVLACETEKHFLSENEPHKKAAKEDKRRVAAK
jgi:hypothetical protein